MSAAMSHAGVCDSEFIKNVENKKVAKLPHTFKAPLSKNVDTHLHTSAMHSLLVLFCGILDSRTLHLI